MQLKVKTPEARRRSLECDGRAPVLRSTAAEDGQRRHRFQVSTDTFQSGVAFRCPPQSKKDLLLSEPGSELNHPATIVLQRIEALAQISEETGKLTRTFASPAMRQGNDCQGNEFLVVFPGPSFL